MNDTPDAKKTPKRKRLGFWGIMTAVTILSLVTLVVGTVWGVAGGGSPALKQVAVKTGGYTMGPYVQVDGKFYGAPPGSNLTVTWPDGQTSVCWVEDGTCNFDLGLSNVKEGLLTYQGEFHASHVMPDSPCSGTVTITLAGTLAKQVAVKCP